MQLLLDPPKFKDVNASRRECGLAADLAAKQAIVECKRKLDRLSARFADLKHRLAKFEPSTKQ
jgi:hypothetical protein